MAILDTSATIIRWKNKEYIADNITVVTMIEFPRILDYEKFRGSIYFPLLEEYKLAYNLQKELYKLGKPKAFADLVIAAIAINRGEKIVTKDTDFLEIAEAAKKLNKTLQVELIG